MSCTTRGKYQIDYRNADRWQEMLAFGTSQRPRRVITAYKLWLPGHTPHYAFLCSECFRSLQEPARAERFGIAPHARGCDWCHCWNEANEEGTR